MMLLLAIYALVGWSTWLRLMDLTGDSLQSQARVLNDTQFSTSDTLHPISYLHQTPVVKMAWPLKARDLSNDVQVTPSTKSAVPVETYDQIESLPILSKPLLAICTCTRSARHWTTLKRAALATTLLPSIVTSVTPRERERFQIRAYIVYDDDDKFWEKYSKELPKLLPEWLDYKIWSVPKTKMFKIPFNQMMASAFEDGAEYMVRVNDDTEFITKGWIDMAVTTLASFRPPNLGVVGPTCYQGHTGILTHDMVHRTHLEVFETYYPSVFSAWWIDDWISKVYGQSRTQKIKEWIVKHHVTKHGTRYKPNHNESKHLEPLLVEGNITIKEWLRKHEGKV